MDPEARPAVHGVVLGCLRCQGVVEGRLGAGVSVVSWEDLWVPLLALLVSWVSLEVPWWKWEEASEGQQKCEGSQRMVQNWQQKKQEWSGQSLGVGMWHSRSLVQVMAHPWLAWVC